MKEEFKPNDGQCTKKDYSKCPTCDKTNHPAERCWKGADARLEPRNLKLYDANYRTRPPARANSQQINNIYPKEPKILDSPLLQINENIRVR